jgi:hypothetical protein
MEYDELKEAAEELVELYEWYSDSYGMEDIAVRLVTHEGLLKMQECFEQVPIERRAEVFQLFLMELDVRGIDYDKEQFGRELN